MWYNKDTEREVIKNERNNIFRTNDSNQCNFINYSLTMHY